MGGEDPLGCTVEFFFQAGRPEHLSRRYDLRHGAQPNVLRTCDLFGSLHQEGYLERGPGRHGVSNPFYAYLPDPDGHRVEAYTSDYYTGDLDHETLRWSVNDLAGEVRSQHRSDPEVTVDADGHAASPPILRYDSVCDPAVTYHFRVLF
jgi:hypothetical protein